MSAAAAWAAFPVLAEQQAGDQPRHPPPMCMDPWQEASELPRTIRFHSSVLNSSEPSVGGLTLFQKCSGHQGFGISQEAHPPRV